MSRVTWFFASFSGVLDWIALILVWFERSLPSAQVSEESCPWPSKLMTSQRVERTWIRMGGYGWFRGEWVKVKKNWANFVQVPSLKEIHGHFKLWNKRKSISLVCYQKLLKVYLTERMNSFPAVCLLSSQEILVLVSLSDPWIVHSCLVLQHL